MKNIFKVIGAAALVLGMSVVSAAAVTIANDGKSVDITCTGLCEFWDLGLSPDAFNAADGTWLSAAYGGIGNNNSNTDRVTFVNNILGTSFTSQSESSDNLSGVPSVPNYSGGDNAGWQGSSEYYLTWGGFDPRYILIRNLTADNVFTWTAGRAGGLSGVDGFGTLPDGCPPGQIELPDGSCGPATGVVPVPAGLPLMLTAIGIGAYMRKRARKSA